MSPCPFPTTIAITLYGLPNRHTSIGRLEKIYIHHVCADWMCSLEDQQKAMYNRDGMVIWERERERERDEREKRERESGCIMFIYIIYIYMVEKSTQSLCYLWFIYFDHRFISFSYHRFIYIWFARNLFINYHILYRYYHTVRTPDGFIRILLYILK